MITITNKQKMADYLSIDWTKEPIQFRHLRYFVVERAQYTHFNHLWYSCLCYTHLLFMRLLREKKKKKNLSKLGYKWKSHKIKCCLDQNADRKNIMRFRFCFRILIELFWLYKSIACISTQKNPYTILI